MLNPPKLWGAEDLRVMVNELTFKKCCKWLQIHPTTLRRWLRADAEPPQAALQALYWMTWRGHHHAYVESHWTHQYMIGKCERLERQLNFTPKDEWQAANEQQFDAPGLQWSLDWPGRA